MEATKWILPLEGRATVTAHPNRQMGGWYLDGYVFSMKRYDTFDDAEAAVLAVDPCAAVVS